MKNSAVAWSFGKGNKSFSQTSRVPGPGRYSLNDVSIYKSKAPHWKLGSAVRSHSVKNLVPGPGEYSITTKIGEAPKYTMRPKTGVDYHKKKKDDPGPGNYDPKVLKKDDYSYSMRIRPNSAAPGIPGVGPGSYDLRKLENDFMKTHSYKFGHEKKHKDPDYTYLKSPAPGTYDFENPFATKSPPKFSFGKEERGTNKRPKTPGPGEYSLKPKIGAEGPKISMSFVRPSTALKNENPGPGRYESNLNTKRKSPEYKIGTSKRELLDKETKSKPGPGTYYPDKVDYAKTKAPQWVFGKDERGDMLNPSKSNPGPGDYEYKKSIGEGPKVSHY